ncbi:hypothetical protein MNBD_GAMMA03-1332 [hydrothermal vent metagenome]|uniref:O-antigen ligase-related domain-containing protein n=1 Tax=hydrothermal vent metagenome TaxID=652676 RepID=A0A3B0WA71_9ZZZZ
MNDLHWNQSKKISTRLRGVFIKNALVVWIGLILTASLYAGKNGGGSGWYLPFNMVVWSVVCLFIMTTFIKVFYHQRLVASKMVLYFCIMLLGILLAGSVFANIQSDVWLQTVLAFGVVGLFFWSLFQYPLTQRHFIYILVVLCVVGFVQSLIAIVQSHDVYRAAYALVPYEAFRFSGDRPLGNFQQVNMLASFLSLVLVTTLYLMLSRVFLNGSRVFNIWLFLVVLSSFYILLLTGSRSGLLAFIVAGICMLVARQRFLRQHRVLFLIWLLALVLAFVLSVYFPGQALGLEFVLEKTGGLSEGARFFLYQYSLKLFMDSPVFGLGIGHFMTPFAEYIRAEQNTALMTMRFTHPHNEWLYWMLQSGWVALLLPLAFAGVYGVYLFKRSYAYAFMVLALLLPFLIQSQLSYPFTLSSVHLFLLLFFLYVGGRFVTKTWGFSVNKALKILLTMVAILLIGMIFYGTWHSLKSIKEVYIFENSLLYTQFQTKEEIANQRYLEHATYHLLYREDAVKAMNSMVEKAIKTNNKYDLNQFIGWATTRMDRGGEKISEQTLWNLAKVYLALGQTSQVGEVAQQWLKKYGVVLDMAELQKQVDAIKHSTESEL